jgi:hypothetical protein
VRALAHHVWALCVLRGRPPRRGGWWPGFGSRALPVGAPCLCRGRDGAARTAQAPRQPTITTSIWSRAAAAGSQGLQLIKGPVSHRRRYGPRSQAPNTRPQEILNFFTVRNRTEASGSTVGRFPDPNKTKEKQAVTHCVHRR